MSGKSLDVAKHWSRPAQRGIHASTDVSRTWLQMSFDMPPFNPMQSESASCPNESQSIAGCGFDDVECS